MAVLTIAAAIIQYSSMQLHDAEQYAKRGGRRLQCSNARARAPAGGGGAAASSIGGKVGVLDPFQYPQ